MRDKFRYLAHQLGERPLLAIALIFIPAAFLSLGLIRFVLQSNGLMLFDLDNRQTAWFMGLLILLTYGTFTWRLLTTNRIIDNILREDFKRKQGREPNADESKQLDLKLEQFYLKGAYLSRNLQVARMIPEPVTAVAMVLIAANIVLKISYELLYNPSQSHQGIVFANTPWVLAILVFVYLVYHDIWSIECLKQKISQLNERDEAGIEQHLKQFLQTLTQTETQCFQKKYRGNARNKEIASALDVSESTIKTHINNINRKWGQYAEKHSIPGHIREFMRQ